MGEMRRQILTLLFENQFIASDVDYTSITTSEYIVKLTRQRKEMYERLRQFAQRYFYGSSAHSEREDDAEEYYQDLNQTLQMMDDHIRMLYPLIQAQLSTEPRDEAVAAKLANAPVFNIQSVAGDVYISSNQAFAERHMWIFAMFRLALSSFVLDFNPDILLFAVGLINYLLLTVKKLACQENGAVELSFAYLSGMCELTLAFGYMKLAQKAVILIQACEAGAGVTFLEVSGLLYNASNEMEHARKNFRKTWLKEGRPIKELTIFSKKMVAALKLGGVYYQLLSVKDIEAQKSLRNHIVREISNELQNFNQVVVKSEISKWIMKQCPFIDLAASYFGKGKHGSFNRNPPCGKIPEREWHPGELAAEIFMPTVPSPALQKNAADDDQYWMFNDF